MDKTTLNKIRTWYQDALEGMDDGSEYRKARWYVQARIRDVNLLLLQSEETKYLDKLDALFIQKIPEVEEPDFQGDFQ